MEGIEKSFTCTVNHTCQKEKPKIIWNYQNMPVFVQTQKVSSSSWKTVSTLKLKASRDDHGKTLTCTAQTTEGETSDHVTLKVKSKLVCIVWFQIQRGKKKTPPVLAAVQPWSSTRSSQKLVTVHFFSSSFWFTSVLNIKNTYLI